MARLPTALDLSGPDNMRSGRVIASQDTSAIGRGLADLGTGIQIAVKKERDQQNTVDIARAEAAKTEGFLGVKNKFANDPDYSTYGKRAPIQTSEVVKTAGNLIRDPNMRERWLLGAGTDALRLNDGINDHGVQIQRQAETVAFDDALEVNRRLYVDPNTPEDVRAKAKKDIEGAIQAGQASGLLDPNAAEARRKNFIEEAEFSRGKLAVDKDPSIISKPMPPKMADRAAAAVGYFQSKGWTKEQAAGIVGNLMAESSLNTGARNGGDGSDGSDSIGIGQWNSGRAQNLKAFAQQNHTDWRDYGTQLAFVQHELEGAEGNAHSLLKNAKDVKSATEAMIMYERPAGSDKGPQNAMAYKQRLQFAAQAAGQDVNPDWYKTLSPEQRYVIDNEVDTRNNQLAVESRAGIDVAVTNAPAAILNTGTYSGDIPDANRFMEAYGPQEGATRYNSFVASMQTNKQAFDMRTMSEADIQTMVNGAKPASSGDDAALQTARYNTLSQAAETTIKAREADPASYVQQAFPSVGQKWEAARTSGNYQDPMAASITAQQQLGIQKIQPLPKEIAASAVTSFKDETKPQEARIGQVASLIMATQDPGQRQMIFNQMVDAGLPDQTEGAFEALSRGDVGAANRLFQAAMVDPTKLAGQAKEGQKPADIDLAVQNAIMDQGQLGDLYYGLSDGTADNYVRAQRDSKLINNAVNLRLRNGETMEAAIAGVSKDLYGDLQVVNDTNMQILVPKDQDVAKVQAGLTARLPDVQKAVEAALAPPRAGPRGPVAGLVEQGNIDLAKRPVVKNADGTISTVRSMSFEEDGKEILVPTVSPDGKILSDQEAVDLYHKTGQHLGMFGNANDATRYAESLHESQASFYGDRASGTAAIIGAAAQNYTKDLIANGYFRNSGDGYVFIDPKTSLAIAGPDGKPIVFQPDMAAPPAPAPQSPMNGGPQPFVPQTDSPVSGIVPKGLEDLMQPSAPESNAVPADKPRNATPAEALKGAEEDFQKRAAERLRK